MSNSIYTVSYDSRLRELPNGYTQLEYIESSGTQWIDTGFTPNYQSACELTMEFTAAVTADVNCGLFGGSGSSRSDKAFECFYQSSTMYYSFGMGYGVGTSLSVNEKFTMKISQSEAKMTKNDTTVFSATPSASTFISPSSFIIFGINRNTTANYLSSSRCYSCKLWSNETLVRDLIPCINTDNEIGLYDLVNEVFYGNSGTGVFIAGNIISTSPKSRKVQNNYAVLCELPENYTQLEYIESTGTQYIDTGFKPNNFSACEVVMSYTVISKTNCGLFGAAGNNYVDKSFECYYQNNLYNLNFGSNQNMKLETTIVAEDIITSYLSQSKAEGLNGSSVIFSKTPTTQTFTSPSNFVIHALNRNGNIEYYSSSRCYSCKLWDNGTLVRNLIPCINSNNEIGLYDLVNSTFYGNNGTGTFIAGPKTENRVVTKRIKKGYVMSGNFNLAQLPEGYTQIEYIESSGTQYIDTGFKHNQNTRLIMDAQVTTKPSGHAWLFDGRNSYTSGSKSLFLLNGSTWTTDYNGSDTRQTINGISVTDRLNIDFNKNTLNVNNFSYTWNILNFQSNYNLTLLACNTAGTVNNNISAKLYFCKIYDNDILIKNFIPCINPSNEIGLYDLVSKTFYGNSGTGNFIAGPAYKKITKLFYEGRN